MTRTAVVATGAQYNTLPLATWGRFEASSIFYAATELEARVCTPGPVVVVGGANSAGQAAVFLADAGSTVTLVVRGTELGARMSRYLIGRVEAHPRIELRTGATVIALHGNGSLDAVTLTDDQGGRDTVACAGLFCFIGATPASGFLANVARDSRGFVRTDRDLASPDLDVEWELLGRGPMPFETNVPPPQRISMTQ